jgi:parallel beta-helix repeat protein
MKIRKRMGTVLLVIGFLGFIVSGLEAKEVKVDCDKGESVQKALDNLDGAATIVVTGICRENIDIRKDDVTIQGGSFVGPDSQQSTIYIEGARRVLIKQATVGGEGNGIAVSQGGTLTVVESTIQDNGKAGIVANFGSSAVVDNCIMQNNSQQGIVVTDNSAVVLTNSTVRANGAAGVLVQRSSSGRIGRSITGVSSPNQITDNRGNGVNVFTTAYALIDGNKIKDNSYNGVFIEGASATVTSNTISNNQGKGVEVNGSGHARIGTYENNQPGPNIIEFNGQQGILIAQGSSAYLLNNQIKSNGLSTNRPGIGVYRAVARLIGGNIIEANGTHGIEVHQGSLFQGRGDWSFDPGSDVIQQNGYSGISAWNGASLDISNANIMGNVHNGISLDLLSTLYIQGSLTNVSNNYHGIWLINGSAVILGSSPVSITNNSDWGVFCGGQKSSLAGNTSGVTENGGGNVNPSCTGF